MGYSKHEAAVGRLITSSTFLCFTLSNLSNRLDSRPPQQPEINNLSEPYRSSSSSENKKQKGRLRAPIGQNADFKNLDAQPVRKDDLGPNDIIIAIMGPTGAGKSTFISTAIGRDNGVGHSLQSYTSQVSAIRVTIMETQVVLVDTPGFDDTYLSDLDILKMISDWLRRTFEVGLELSGLLYMHRISDNRMAGTPLKNLDMFRKLCGEEGFKKVVLTTTMWPDVDDREATGAAIEREDELKRLYWSDMIKGGSRTLRFENTQQSAWHILDKLITLRLTQRSILIQYELVTLGKHLPNTAAGQQLYGIIEKLVERQRDVLQRMREELKKTSDASTMQALVAELHEIREERENAVHEMQQLDWTLAGRLRRLLHGTPRRSRRAPKPIITFPFEERSRSLFWEILRNQDRITRICDLQGDDAQYLADFLDLLQREKGTLTTEEQECVRFRLAQLRTPNQQVSPREVNYERVYNILLSLSRIDIERAELAQPQSSNNLSS
ncbi:hypothetical protein P691DRAFT_779787 [Macrolepiota fuliginosa MF-IS2]|uniref:G domain-containing protein n=1 Tax=Macrolepiota fuliginosa MF-IS2 TaxID=1400762 RepID=A0A9P5X245_9AGAR|nr:hypothetical protein P691DRAFT_779787 [Macrolepiota fuliginosa MF-IS2]